MNKRRTTALIAFSVVATSLGACSRADNAADSAAARTDSAAGRVDSATRAATDSATRNMGTSGWTEPSILGYALAANNGEVSIAQLAEKKATNAKVKAFARELVADHRAMATETKSMASKLNAQADTMADNAHDLMSQSEIDGALVGGASLDPKSFTAIVQW